MPEEITLSVFRGDRSGGREESYPVPLTPGMVVLDAVHYVQANLAPDLAVRWNCKAAHCGSCSAEINGRPRLMCKARLDEYEGVVHVRPMHTFPLIKDLVTDVSWNYEVQKKIAPLQPAAPAPFHMYQPDVDRLQEFRKCIECYLCQNTCHVIRDHAENENAFAGPRFLMRVAELEMHPADMADRRDIAQDDFGLGFCNITKCCTEVCPEHIKITDNALIPLKERVAGRKYDPLVWLGSKISRRPRDAGTPKVPGKRH